jgi:hypothetical protein
MEDVPFTKQVKIAMRNCGYIDPERIEEYFAKKGYVAFLQALKKTKPSEIIDIVKASGLRGRGGGGFPAAIKWATCAKHQGIDMSSATRMKATPALTWTGAFWKAIPTVFSKACSSRPCHRLPPGLYLCAQ